jgi:hypothetical protein
VVLASYSTYLSGRSIVANVASTIANAREETYFY